MAGHLQVDRVVLAGTFGFPAFLVRRGGERLDGDLRLTGPLLEGGPGLPGCVVVQADVQADLRRAGPALLQRAADRVETAAGVGEGIAAVAIDRNLEHEDAIVTGIARLGFGRQLQFADR